MMINYNSKDCKKCVTWLILCTSLHMGVSEKQMRAIVLSRYGPPQVLKVENIPIPTFSHNEILVKVKAAGINPIDAYIRDGSYHAKPPLPTILGKEISGLVEEQDPSVTNFKRSDRVFCGIDQGGYAEYAVANASHCYLLPDTLSYNQGAALYIIYFAAYKALVRKARLKAGEIVLIHGANGSIGTAAIQIAKIIGAYVVATVGEFAFEELTRKAGADHVVYHDKDDYLYKALKDINQPGFDAILEVFTNVNVTTDKLFLNPGGRIIAMGDRFRLREFDNELKKGDFRLHSVSFTKSTDKQEQLAAQFILNSAKFGWIAPVVARKYELEEAVKAHTHISYTKSSRGKLVFRM